MAVQIAVDPASSVEEDDQSGQDSAIGWRDVDPEWDLLSSAGPDRPGFSDHRPVAAARCLYGPLEGSTTGLVDR
jgi:hypothetical protein